MATESSTRFFQSNSKRNSLLFVEDIALDIFDINYIEFDDKARQITVGFKNRSEHLFEFDLATSYRRTKFTILGFIDKNK